MGRVCSPSRSVTKLHSKRVKMKLHSKRVKMKLHSKRVKVWVRSSGKRFENFEDIRDEITRETNRLCKQWGISDEVPNFTRFECSFKTFTRFECSFMTFTRFECSFMTFTRFECSFMTFTLFECSFFQVIVLKIFSPNVIDLTLVDLPGVTKVTLPGSTLETSEEENYTRDEWRGKLHSKRVKMKLHSEICHILWINRSACRFKSENSRPCFEVYI